MLSIISVHSQQPEAHLQGIDPHRTDPHCRRFAVPWGCCGCALLKPTSLGRTWLLNAWWCMILPRPPLRRHWKTPGAGYVDLGHPHSDEHMEVQTAPVCEGCLRKDNCSSVSHFHVMSSEGHSMAIVAVCGD